MNNTRRTTAKANSNIAFIKYWGNTDHHLRLPQNASISMNLEGLQTVTTVEWQDSQAHDKLTLNNETATGKAVERIQQYMDMFRERYGVQEYAHVTSENNFPMGAGIASSASSFAALATAAAYAAQLDLSEKELTTLARLGSGSASRSVPTGFVMWHQGDSHETSYAETIADENHWPLIDIVAIVSDQHKKVGSTHGHPLADTSDLQAGRLLHVNQRLQEVQDAILNKDFEKMADVVELDSNLMHSVMMTSQPSLFYWEPASLTVMHLVRQLRQEGVEVFYTLDAGPNVHCIVTENSFERVQAELKQVDSIKNILSARAGQGAQVING